MGRSGGPVKGERPNNQCQALAYGPAIDKTLPLSFPQGLGLSIISSYCSVLFPVAHVTMAV